MKSMKSFFSSLLLLLVACQFSQAEHVKAQILPAYQNFIQDIILGYDNDGLLTGDILLNNGLLMHITGYKKRDDNVLKLWQPGDAVAFQADVHKQALRLSVHKIYGHDKDVVEPYVVFDFPNSSSYQALKIAAIIDEGKTIELNDGSFWKFNFWNRIYTRNWEVGQTVLVSGNGEDKHYHFINLDAPVTLRVHSANATIATKKEEIVTGVEIIEVQTVETVQVPTIEIVEVPKTEMVEVTTVEVVEVPKTELVEVTTIELVEVPKTELVEVQTVERVEVETVKTVEVAKTEFVEVPKTELVEVPVVEILPAPAY